MLDNGEMEFRLLAGAHFLLLFSTAYRQARDPLSLLRILPSPSSAKVMNSWSYTSTPRTLPTILADTCKICTDLFITIIIIIIIIIIITTITIIHTYFDLLFFYYELFIVLISYYTLARPKSEYASPVWNNFTSDADKLERIQRKSEALCL
jgi:hypothetical protein